MANEKTLTAAREARLERRQAIAAETRAQAVSKLQESLISSPLTTSSVTGRLAPADDFYPLEFPDSDTPMAPPSDDGSEKAAPGTRSRTKRKSNVVSDASDVEPPVAKPARKKPGPKPKGKPAATPTPSDSEPEAVEKPAKKAAGKGKKAKAARKKKTAESDSDVEVFETEIVFMIPEGTSEGNRRVSLGSSTSFEDALEAIHETMGCVSVSRKPTLAYKFSTSNGKEATINLTTDKDWTGLVTDAVAKIKAKKDVRVTIFALPDNYMFSLRAKHKKTVPSAKGKKKVPMKALDLDNDESEPDDEEDVGIVDGERKAMADLEAEYRKCVRCGPTHLCKIDRGGNHVHLSFPQRRAWAVSLACGTLKVTEKTPPEGEMFKVFHKKPQGNPSPPPTVGQFPPHGGPHGTYPWYPPMPPVGYGMPGFAGYPQTPVAPTGPPAHALPPMLSSDPAEDSGPSYPSISDFINTLIVKTPQRYSLRDAAAAFDLLHFFDINEIVHLTADNLGEAKFGGIVLGDAQFLVKEVAKEVKRLEKLARRARYQ